MVLIKVLKVFRLFDHILTDNRHMRPHYAAKMTI